LTKCEEHAKTCQKCSEEKGVSKAAMSPEIVVVNAETEADDIHIRNDRTECSDHPDSFWRSRLVETRSDAEGCHRM